MRSPVVIRDAIKQSKALKIWNQNFLTKSYGNEKVLVHEMANDLGARNTTIKTLKEFFDINKSRGKVGMTLVPSSSIIENNALHDFLSPIEDDLTGPKGEKNSSHYLFSTSGENYKFIAEIGNNLFRQIVGKKLYTLIDPQENFYLCPGRGHYSYTAVESCISNIPFDKRSSWIRKIPRYTVVLQPGDILINGGYWWYDISSVEKILHNKERENGEMMIGVISHTKNIRGSLYNAPLHTIAASLQRIY